MLSVRQILLRIIKEYLAAHYPEQEKGTANLQNTAITANSIEVVS